MEDSNCLFCQIVSGSEPSKFVWENDDFLAIKNKFPIAPIHVLVLDKKHREKQDTISGKFSGEEYWDKMFNAIFKVIENLKLNDTGYKLVNNGAGYNHFEHEHFHIVGGSKNEPGGIT